MGGIRTAETDPLWCGQAGCGQFIFQPFVGEDGNWKGSDGHRHWPQGGRTGSSRQAFRDPETADCPHCKTESYLDDFTAERGRCPVCGRYNEELDMGRRHSSSARGVNWEEPFRPDDYDYNTREAAVRLAGDLVQGPLERGSEYMDQRPGTEDLYRLKYMNDPREHGMGPEAHQEWGRDVDEAEKKWIEDFRAETGYPWGEDEDDDAEYQHLGHRHTAYGQDYADARRALERLKTEQGSDPYIFNGKGYSKYDFYGDTGQIPVDTLSKATGTDPEVIRMRRTDLNKMGPGEQWTPWAQNDPPLPDLEDYGYPDEDFPDAVDNYTRNWDAFGKANPEWTQPHHSHRMAGAHDVDPEAPWGNTVDDDPYRDLIPTPDFAGLALDGDYEGRHRTPDEEPSVRVPPGADPSYRIYRDWQDRGGFAPMPKGIVGSHRLAAIEFLADQNTDDREELLFRAHRHASEQTGQLPVPVAQRVVRDFVAAVNAQIPRRRVQASRPVTQFQDFSDELLY